MKKIVLTLFFLVSLAQLAIAQSAAIESYTRKTYMTPMRDGVKLYTLVLTPASATGPLPFLIQRTPYGAALPDDFNILRTSSLAALARDGYIFVFQDLRGKFKSEGVFEMSRPLYHLSNKSKTDESTDAYDTVDWLLKNIANNNGKAGIFGISYLGATALDATSDPHPALKASSPQASPVDMFLGDDFYHNGAFRLSYGFEYSYMVEQAKDSNSNFPFPTFDLYDWYLRLGSLKNVNEKFYKNKIPSWNNFTLHPNYDSFWQKQSKLLSIHYPQIPVLHVGGYYDQEDLNGPQIMYHHMEKKDSANRNYLLLGPWSHGQWAARAADSLGKIHFESKTAVWFQNIQKQWFDYWLKGIGDGKFAEAHCFQTGSNKWRSYNTWPPKEAEIKRLYTHADGSSGFDRPQSSNGVVNYISDPSKPVPYRPLPIEATYGTGSRWRAWQTEDQRFVTSRPDVISFSADSLQHDLTITGGVKAHIFVSTTASDADFIVKLIDVYPDYDQKNILMSGYQLPVTMEVFRGRFRKSFEKPAPFVPNKPEEIVIDLHYVNHTFLKGHRLMIQIQSTWFPVIDRNPQKFVPNIFQAKESDFIKATHTVYCNNELSSYIELPVIKE
jgi:putative CocE/NonD family hydrolase